MPAVSEKEIRKKVGFWEVKEEEEELLGKAKKWQNFVKSF